jgi:signal transduction histidine kinase
MMCGARRVATLSRVTALRARLDSNPLLVDALLALSLTSLSIVTLLGGARDIGSYHPSSIALLFLQTIPLVARRIAPLPIFLLTATATVVHALLAEGPLNTTLGSFIALFSVAEAYGRRRSAVLALTYAAVLAALIASRGGVPRALSALIQTELAVLVAWTLGTWARERRAYLGSVEDRAARAEREREVRAQRAVSEERERIARELHDVVTHHVSVIVIQAGAARRALERRPDDVREAIDAIDATGRQALADMRRMLGILGTATDTDTSRDGATLEPMPGMERLGPLLESVRAAGLPVELSIEGDRRPLDPGVELSAYRIIQEALTNTLKHAGGGRARVDVRYEPFALEVHVADEGGRGGGDLSAEGAGRGLIGMRERVAMFGGTLEAGPGGGGFRVAARLPLDGSSAS